MSEITRTVAEIRERHERFEHRTSNAPIDCWQAHKDRGYLLRQNELLIGRCEYDTETRDALCKELDQAEKRIAELEALVEKTAEDGATVGWMIAEDRLRKRIAELEAELSQYRKAEKEREWLLNMAQEGE